MNVLRIACLEVPVNFPSSYAISSITRRFIALVSCCPIRHSPAIRSVCEAEVQTLVTLVRRCCEVVLFFLRRHCIPLLISICVDANVEELRTNKHKYVVDTDANEYTVASAVQRLVVSTIDLYLVSLCFQERGCDDLRWTLRSNWLGHSCYTARKPLYVFEPCQRSWIRGLPGWHACKGDRQANNSMPI